MIGLASRTTDQKSAVVTIVTRNYLPGAVVLHRSCSEHFPEADFFCVIIDVIDVDADLSSRIGCIDAKKLFEGGSWQPLFFKYTAFELCCALKPFALRFLANKGYQQLAYVDADIAFTAPPESLVKCLNEFSVVLTPHTIIPEQEVRDSFYLKSGVFNAGLVACRNDEIGGKFLDWWSARLESHCCDDINNGLFVDQKWLDLVPCLFPSVGILRNPGVNTGHWTLHNSEMKRDRESYWVNDSRVEAFHFSHLSDLNQVHQFCLTVKASTEKREALTSLVSSYQSSVNSVVNPDWANPGYLFNSFANGTPIKRVWRNCYRSDNDLARRFDRPFDPDQGERLLGELIKVERKFEPWRLRVAAKGIRSYLLQCFKALVP
jgi:hypothetical protein